MLLAGAICSYGTFHFSDVDYAFFIVCVDLWSADGKREMNLVLHPSSADRYIPTPAPKPRRRPVPVPPPRQTPGSPTKQHQMTTSFPLRPVDQPVRICSARVPLLLTHCSSRCRLRLGLAIQAMDFLTRSHLAIQGLTRRLGPTLRLARLGRQQPHRNILVSDWHRNLWHHFVSHV